MSLPKQAENRESMKVEKRNRRSHETGSALSGWSKIVAVSCLFLIVLPRCAGCKSPIDPLLEKIYGVEMDQLNRGDPAKDWMLEE